jgi:hypothetical protein
MLLGKTRPPTPRQLKSGKVGKSGPKIEHRKRLEKKQFFLLYVRGAIFFAPLTTLCAFFARFESEI